MINGSVLIHTKTFFCPKLDTRSKLASSMVPNFLFFNVFIFRQAHLHPKVTKQANFRGSLQTVRIFSQSPVKKRLKIESQFFAAMLFGPNTSKKYFMFTLIKNQVLMILS